MSGKKILITAWLVLALLSLSFVPSHAFNIGQPTPQLIGQTIDQKGFDLSQQKDQVVLVHFWATWCGPCMVEMPILDKFYRQHAAQGLTVIAISADTPKHRDDVVKFMQPYTFQAAMLSDFTTNGFGAPQSIPATYVIDSHGIIRAILTPDTNPLTDKVLSDAVGPYLVPRPLNVK